MYYLAYGSKAKKMRLNICFGKEFTFYLWICIYINLYGTVIAMNKNIFVLMIMATVVATGTIIPRLTSHVLNLVMAQHNMTKGNTTAGNMTSGENITSTSPVGICQPCCIGPNPMC